MTISINDITVNRSAGLATLTVTLSTPAPVGGVTVQFDTQANTANPPFHYTTKSGLVSFAQGETSKTISVVLK